MPVVLLPGQIFQFSCQVEGLRQAGDELDALFGEPAQRVSGDEHAVGDEDDVLVTLVFKELLHLQHCRKVPLRIRFLAGQEFGENGQSLLLYSGADLELFKIHPVVLAVGVLDLEQAVAVILVGALHRFGGGVQMY